MSSKQKPQEGAQSETDEALSHPVDTSRLPAKGLQVVLKPDEQIRAQIAEQLQLVSLTQFASELKIKSWHKDGVRVTGSIKAQLEQTCVVTLEPVSETIDAEFDAVFVPEMSKLAKPNISAETQELIIEAEGDDAPEVFDPPTLDIGKVALEFFALELNPYPRSAQADHAAAAPVDENDKAGDKENPFAALSQIRDKL